MTDSYLIHFNADLKNAILADLFNALGETDKDPKQLGKMGAVKLRAKVVALAEEKEFDLADSAALSTLWAQGSLVKYRQAEAEAAAAKKAEEELAKKASAIEEKPAAVKPAAKEPKVKGPTIRSVAEGLLQTVVAHDADGRALSYSYEEILSKVKEQFPNAKTTIACLRWYGVHMRGRDERVPLRPRAQPQKPKED